MNYFVPPFKAVKYNGVWTVQNGMGGVIGIYGSQKMAKDTAKEFNKKYGRKKKK